MKTSTAVLFIFFIQLAGGLESSVLKNLTGFGLLEGMLYTLAVLSMLFGLVTIRRELSWRWFAGLIVVVLISGISVFFSRGREFVLVVLHAVALIGANEKKVLKAYLCANLLTLAIALFCGTFNIGGKLYYISVGLRFISLGFLHKNMAGTAICRICMSFLCLNYDTHRRRAYMVILLSAAVMWFVVECRTAALGMLVLFLLMVSQKLWLRRRFVRRVLPYLFLMFLAGSVFIAYNFDRNNVVWLGLTGWLSGRLDMWQFYTRIKSLTLLGDFFYTADVGSLDNAYLYMLYRYGILALAMCAWINVTMAKTYLDSGNNVMLICMVASQIMALFEFGPMTINCNVAMIVFFTQQYTRKSRRLKLTGTLEGKWLHEG